MVVRQGVGHHRPMDNLALIDQYAAGPADPSSLPRRALAARDWPSRPAPTPVRAPASGRGAEVDLLRLDDGTEIQVYDQERWAAEPRLGYDGPIELPLAVLEAVRASSAALLRRLHDADFAWTGHHVEHDTYSVQLWLEIYADHAHDHADQIRRARRGEP